MDREIEAHLDMRVDDLVRTGMTPEAARAEAARRFGDLESARPRLRSEARRREAALRQRDWLGSIVGDVKFAARQARRSAGFTCLAVATLALGIGVTTAMFTLVERVLIRPLPFPQSEQLVALSSRDSLQETVRTVSSADWLDWRDSKTLQGAALYFDTRVSVTDADSATRLPGELVSGNFFRVLRPRFLVGRPFTEEEAQSRAQVLVVSQSLWRRTLGGDTRLATPLRVGARSYTVVGVVAEGEEYPAGTDVWMPVAFTPEGGDARNNINWFAVGRLRPGISISQASGDLGRLAREIEARDPVALYAYGVDVGPLQSLVIGDAGAYLRLLMASVAFVLLIVCANLAAATLGRGAVRSREMSVRAALGAGRGRLAQQLLIEHLLLALAGGMAGIVLAWAGIRGLLASWGSQIPRADDIHVDIAVFAFALGVSLVVGVTVGMAPAVVGSRTSLRGLIASGGRGATRGGRNMPGTLLVGGEIAMALVLLVGAGLLIRSFRTVLGRDLGFDSHVATAAVALSGPRYAESAERRIGYWDALLESFRAIPGVTAVGAANWIPLEIAGAGFIEVAGREIGGAGAGYRVVSEDYFRTLQIPLLAGRTFAALDGQLTERVVVINQRMANVEWPRQSPIGRLVRATSQERGRGGAPAPWLRVIGVVGDVRHWGFEYEATPEMYVLFRQVPARSFSMTVLVRGSLPASQLASTMRRRARAIDPRLAVEVGVLDRRLDILLASRRLTMSLLSGFAALALLLAALGVYGVLSYSVAQRTRELAVRSALGAQRTQLLALVMRAASRIVAAGGVVGLIAALGLSKVMRAMLVDVSPADPVTYAIAVSALVVVSAAAVTVPAYRASRLDPMIALQAE